MYSILYALLLVHITLKQHTKLINRLQHITENYISVVLHYQGNVECWLADLLKVTRLSVHDVIRSASTAITDANFKLLDFEKVFPAQVCGSLLLRAGGQMTGGTRPGRGDTCPSALQLRRCILLFLLNIALYRLPEGEGTFDLVGILSGCVWPGLQKMGADDQRGHVTGGTCPTITWD